MLDRLEKQVRKVLGMPEETISPTEMITEKEDENQPYTTIKGFVNREKEWQDMPASEYYVSETFRRLRRAQYGVEDYIARIRNQSDLPLIMQLMPSQLSWKAEKQAAYNILKDSQTLIFSSNYIHELENTYEVEGFFVCKQGTYTYNYPLTIFSRKAFEVYQESEEKINQVFTDQEKDSIFFKGRKDQDKPNAETIISTSPFWGNHIIVNSDTITPEVLEKALQKWYTEEFYYTHHHWTQCGEHLPTIDIKQMSWQTKEEWEAELTKWSKGEEASEETE